MVSTPQRIPVLPTLCTLGNVFCGLLALAKAVDALTLSDTDPTIFYRNMETACLLVFVGMVFDSLDGWVARLTRGFSDFGAQLDSLADVLTFGLVPGVLAKVLIEHERAVWGYRAFPRLHFLAAAAFSVMAILRLARFNTENDHDAEAHRRFTGLPSPAAAGSVAATIWLYLILRRPELESSEGTPTPLGHLVHWFASKDLDAILSWVPGGLAILLPCLGFLMVSRVRYSHAFSLLTQDRRPFQALVGIVFVFLLVYAAPVPVIFVAFNGFVLIGLFASLLGRYRQPAKSGERTVNP